MGSYLDCSAKVFTKLRKRGDKQTIERKKLVAKRMGELAEAWERGDYKNVKDAGYNDSVTFEERWEKVNHVLDPTEIMPTIHDVRKFEYELNSFNKELGKKNGWINAMFKLPARKLSKLPETDIFRREMIGESSYFRRNVSGGMKKVNTILKEFKHIVSDLGGNTKKYSDIERRLDYAMAKDDSIAVRDILVEKRAYLEKGSGAGYTAIMKAFQGADIETIPELTTRNSKSRMYKIMSQYQELRKDTAVSLIRALEKIIHTAKDDPKYSKVIDEIKSKIKQIEFQKIVDKKGNNIDAETFEADADILKLGFTVKETDSFMDKKGNVALRQYMPQYVLGIPKMLKSLDKVIRNELDSGESSEKILESIGKDLSKMDQLINHAKSRNPNMDNIYSMDPFYFLKRYVNDISVFNYRTHLKDSFKKVYSSLLDRHINAKTNDNVPTTEMLQDMLKLTHNVYDTLHTIDPTPDKIGNNLMRIGTAYTYFRLLGGNFRSAGRNGTQRIHELNKYGINGINQARRFYDSDGNSSNHRKWVHEQQELHGLLWTKEETIRGKILDALKTGKENVSEASRGALEESYMSDFGLTVNQRGELVYSQDSITKKGARIMSKIAEKSALMHRIVEDWNRTSTFRTSFALVYENLSRMSLDWKKHKSGLTNKEAIDKWQINEAGKIAYNSVIDIHYEYAKWAKAKGLQGKPGQFFGQFMHYRFSLFDMMFQWTKQAGISMASGDFTSDEVWRMVRLGTNTMIINGVFAPLINLNFSSLFQNDVAETADAAYTYLSADRNNPEEMKELEKKTYGQGGFYFLGANPNFLLSLLELHDFYMMDEIAKADYEEDNQFMKSDERRKKHMMGSLINAQASRTWNYTMPLFWKRGITDAFKLEMSLHPTKEIRYMRKKAKQWLGKNIHPSLGEKSKKRKVYTYKEQQKLLQSIANISNK